MLRYFLYFYVIQYLVLRDVHHHLIVKEHCQKWS